MQATSRLLQSARITLFTRANCGLCDSAKSVLSRLQTTRPFAYREVDIIKPEAQAWRDLYDFDVPVIHISKSSAPQEDPTLASKAAKLMHRFTEEEVAAKMRTVEESS
ncbi:unnamed protein product [Parascedosporium putredinis]|uniref:Glutaredoxin-like protein n=1 Tax=Parascedosporium putredinis TaxID=1442378 RepID=A0A9P1H5M7_9PEZI|nr:unnamed protein product [Parascedosporium putredinis]CAI7997977.1 unnamed protein product [Parascedosporium putredinis]